MDFVSENGKRRKIERKIYCESCSDAAKLDPPKLVRSYAVYDPVILKVSKPCCICNKMVDTIVFVMEQ